MKLAERPPPPAPTSRSALLRGSLDAVTRDQIAGWAQDPDQPNVPVSLLITVDDDLVARVLADLFRADLQAAGIGNGRHSFEVNMGLTLVGRALVAVRRESDGAHLPGSPVLLTADAQLDDACRRQFARMLDTQTDAVSLDANIAFLTAQAERLMQRRGRRRDGTAAGQSPPRRALVIDTTAPCPSRDAGSQAVLSHMRALRRLGFAVVFAASDMSGAAAAMLAEIGIDCCHAPRHGSVEEVLRRDPGGFDLVYLHRVAMASSYLALVRIHQPRARLVYSVADLHHLRFARQAAAEDRPELVATSQRLRTGELLAAAAADAVITHSTHEAAVLRSHLPETRVHVVPWDVAVRPTGTPFAARHGVGFIGHYGHRPNVDAAHWLIEEIMPLVRGAAPAIGCVLAGSAMPGRLGQGADGIEALGQVATPAALFDRVRLTVAPMTYGAGIKGKVVASLAAGVPCVCTPVAAEGLELPAILLELVAADAAGLAALIRRLHEDAALNAACAQAGLAYVADRLSEERIDGLLRDVVGVAV